METETSQSIYDFLESRSLDFTCKCLLEWSCLSAKANKSKLWVMWTFTFYFPQQKLFKTENFILGKGGE